MITGGSHPSFDHGHVLRIVEQLSDTLILLPGRLWSRVKLSMFENQKVKTPCQVVPGSSGGAANIQFSHLCVFIYENLPVFRIFALSVCPFILQ